MSEIAELERRITAALTRIGRGLDALPTADDMAAAAAAAAAETAAAPQIDAESAEALRAQEAEILHLRQELAAEREASRHLPERLAATGEQQETGAAALERKLADMTRQLDVQGLEVQRMKKTNIQLRETIRTLREAMEQDVGAPHLINKSMLAELEALRAARAAEMAEMDEILGGLEPLLGRISTRAGADEENSDA